MSHTPGYIKYTSDPTTDYSSHSSRANSLAYSQCQSFKCEAVGGGQGGPPEYNSASLRRITQPYVHQIQHENIYRPPSPMNSYYGHTTHSAAPPYSGAPYQPPSVPSTYQAPVTQQPRRVESPCEDERPWNSDLCQCCDGSSTCCAICCCLPCFECWLADNLGEGCCLPICVPMSTMAMRTKVRLTNNIQGSLLGDCCASIFCKPCVLCQIKRELDFIESRDKEQNPSNTQTFQPRSINDNIV